MTPLQAEIMRRYMDGQDRKQIIAETGYHERTVHNVICKFDGPARTRIDIAKLAEHAAQGWTAKQIGREYGWHPDAVSKRARVAGMKLRRSPEQPMRKVEAAPVPSDPRGPVEIDLATVRLPRVRRPVKARKTIPVWPVDLPPEPPAQHPFWSAYDHILLQCTKAADLCVAASQITVRAGRRVTEADARTRWLQIGGNRG